MARLVMDQLIAAGEVRRGRIGVVLRIPEPAGSDGALIEKVEPQSPAERAGISKGDVVTFANGVPVKSGAQFRNLVGLLPVGTEVDIRYRRGTELRTAKVRIEPMSPKLSVFRLSVE